MIEEGIARKMMENISTEKTFIDKILGKSDTDRLRELIQKDPLQRKDMLEILYLLGGTEAKLFNYNDWDRYIILKFFVWIREFVKISELMYDYEDEVKEGNIKLSPRAQQILKNNQRLMQHNAKFLIDLYLNIGRTTLSVGALGISELLKNKFEISYPQAATAGQGTKPLSV